MKSIIIIFVTKNKTIIHRGTKTFISGYRSENTETLFACGNSGRSAGSMPGFRLQAYSRRNRIVLFGTSYITQ